jgi:exosome complex component RRP45
MHNNILFYFIYIFICIILFYSRSEEEVLISRDIEKALRRSRAIDTDGLCIVAGEKVWQIRIDLLFLDHDGNLIDCACIAAITALLHFRRPDITVIGEDVVIVSDNNI